MFFPLISKVRGHLAKKLVFGGSNAIPGARSFLMAWDGSDLMETRAPGLWVTTGVLVFRGRVALHCALLSRTKL